MEGLTKSGQIMIWAEEDIQTLLNAAIKPANVELSLISLWGIKA